MARTRGRVRLELPVNMRSMLTGSGFVYLPASDREAYHGYRHRDHAALYLRIVASNIPGDTDIVTASVTGPGVDPFTLRADTDHLRARLQKILRALDGLTVWER